MYQSVFISICCKLRKHGKMWLYDYIWVLGYMGLCLQTLRSDFPCNSGWMVFFSNRLGVMSWSKLLMPDFLLCCCLSQWFGYGNLFSTANWLWNTTEYVSNGGCPTWASLAKEYPKFRRVVDHPIPSWTEIVVASPTYRHPQVRLQRLNFPQEIHFFFRIRCV